MRRRTFERIKSMGSLLGSCVWLAGALYSIWSGQVRWFLFGFLFAWLLTYVFIRGWLERHVSCDE